MTDLHIYMDDVRTGPFHSGIVDPKDWPDWVIVRSVANTKRFLEMGIVGKLSLDHDMGEGESGYDLTKWMAETGYWPKDQIWIHSANPVGRDNMVATIERYHPEKIKPIIGAPHDWAVR